MSRCKRVEGSVLRESIRCTIESLAGNDISCYIGGKDGFIEEMNTRTACVLVILLPKYFIQMSLSTALNLQKSPVLPFCCRI